jgi:zinc D-Ala-D-Ala carboxypeptidase
VRRRLARVARMLAAAALLGLAVAHAPTPPCAFGDVMIAGDLHTDHATMLLDTTHRLPADAAPRDLVRVREAGFDSDHLVRAVLIDDLRALRRAAAEAGMELAVQSAYRSFAYQQQVFANWVAALGEERARRVSARPGHSEHQLGTAIDLRSASGPPPWELADWAQTPEGAWVALHAHRFGFVMSYPAESEEVTCYDYEPWHFRWIGRDPAAAVQASGMALRAWLHAHHPPRSAP